VPGLFIDVKLSPGAAKDPELARKLAEACPVDIFAAGAEGVRIVPENLDECTLCDLCLQAAPPGALRIVKLYEP
jgi:NAD-dependent dihydropyrimidine dehydrogenase PreA subunit